MSSCPKCGADRAVRLGEVESEERLEPTASPSEQPEPVRYRCLACKHEWTRDDDPAR